MHAEPTADALQILASKWGLNTEQARAVAHSNGPLVVFAGAGSGKTRVITTRIARLIESGVAPWQILAVTFTNKAASEMRSRVAQLSPEGFRSHIATFHSACARWLREFAGDLGFRRDFSIYDDSDSSGALKKVIREMFPEVGHQPLLATVKHFIHLAKTEGVFPSEAERFAAEARLKLPHGTVALYKRYQEYLAVCNAMDFDDLLMNVLLLLRRNENVRDALQKRYRYLLIDEFQDTNRAQLELIQLLAAKHQNVFVVGDDDQSIYSWRGATPSNILNFDKIFPGAQRIVLAQNYRSRSNIVSAASVMISHNKFRAPKELYSEIPAGDPIDYSCESDAQMEAFHVTDRIKQELTHYSYADFAIFYRTNAQSRVLEDALRSARIPFRIFGTLQFYERLEIKDVLAYLRLTINEDDDASLRRIINVPTRGFGKKSLEQLEDAARLRNKSLYKTIVELVGESSSKQQAKLGILLTTLMTIREQVSSAEPVEAVNILLEIVDYTAHLQRKFPDQYQDKIENIHELTNALAEFFKRNPEGRLADWLEQTSLSSEEEEDGVEGISMMTLHLAKGLEFKRVFIAGVEEGLLPHRNNSEEQELLEEERRLFYVGMTRAKEKLTLLSASQRMFYNQHQANEPSRFLQEIPAEHLKCTGILANYNSSLAKLQENSDSPADSDGYSYVTDEDVVDAAVVRPGVMVRHPTYGRGRVENVKSDFGWIKAVVHFEEFGLRSVPIQHLQIHS